MITGMTENPVIAGLPDIPTMHQEAMCADA